jgi:LPS sulfotransferase NodH
LAQFFPNPRFAYLRRLDRLRQAVSLLRAIQTGVFRQIQGVPYAAPNCGAGYDYEKILHYLGVGDYTHSHWEEFFRTTSADLRRVSYEDLVRDYDSTIRGLFAFLGAQDAPVAPPRLERQSDRISEEFLMRFLREYRNNAGQPDCRGAL